MTTSVWSPAAARISAGVGARPEYAIVWKCAQGIDEAQDDVHAESTGAGRAESGGGAAEHPARSNRIRLRQCTSSATASARNETQLIARAVHVSCGSDPQ